MTGVLLKSSRLQQRMCWTCVFESPKLLMLSGIGPRDQLRQRGITPVVESPPRWAKSAGPPDLVARL
jgi:choline dehydrogenase-like flavoprotein